MSNLVSSNVGSFPRSAAKLAVLIPAAVILINAPVSLAGEGIIGRLVAMFAALILIAFVPVGFALAVIALCSMRRYGRQGLLVRGIIGVTFNGVFLIWLGVGLAKSFAEGRSLAQAFEAQRKFRVSLSDVRQSLRDSFEPDYGVTNVDVTDTRAVRDSLDNAAENAPGEAAKILQAAAAYFEQLDAAERNLNGAKSVAQAGRVLQFPNGFDADDFARRRRVVRNYQAASEKVRAVLKNAPALYRTELERLGVAPAEMDKAVEEMQTRSEVQKQLRFDLGKSDHRMTSAMLQIFDLLEQYPDQWQWTSGRVVFSQPHIGNTYDRLVYEIQTAGVEQLEAQRKLASLR